MRLWSIRPRFLDRMGLLGLWREALLAQKVLLAGPPYKVPYGQHPQLERFKKHHNPVSAIGFYLKQILAEAKHRGYNFNPKLISRKSQYATPIRISVGQINFELDHLMAKLRSRDTKKWCDVYEELEFISETPTLQNHYVQRRVLGLSFQLDWTKEYPEPWEILKGS